MILKMADNIYSIRATVCSGVRYPHPELRVKPVEVYYGPSRLRVRYRHDRRALMIRQRLLEGVPEALGGEALVGGGQV